MMAVNHKSPTPSTHRPRRAWVQSLVVLLACGLSAEAGGTAAGGAEARRAEAIPQAKAAEIFQKHCYGCHGPAKSKGDLRLDRLDPDLVNGHDADRWREVLDRLNFGDMPPEKEPPLAAEDREVLTGWLVQERRRASLAKNPATQFRRLTRREYERTMQDLLGMPLPFAARLPEDGRPAGGFRNNGEGLRMSPLQYEMFLQIAEEALAEAIVTGPPPEVHRYRLGFAPPSEKSRDVPVTPLPSPADRPGESFAYFRGEGSKQAPAFRIWNMSPVIKEKEKVVPPDGTLPPAAIGRYSEAAVKLPQYCMAVGFHRAFRKGEAMIRVRVARVPTTQPAAANETGAQRNPVLTVALGCTNFHGVELKTVGEPVTIDHDEYRTYDLRVRMESMPAPNSGPPADKNAAVLAAWNAAKVVKGEANPPRLKIEWIEFENPFLQTWPPASHTNVLFPNDRGLDEPAYAREVVGRFASRAYRRPLESREVDRLMAYWADSRKTADSLEASLRDTLSVVLSSPQFLGLVAGGPSAPGPRQRLDDHELASRLSYFLWSTAPDETLAGLAGKSQLRKPDVLEAQTRRLIRDPKSWQFVEQFAEQWLELDRLERVTVSRERYRGVDDELLASMRVESLHFFAEVLRGDLSVLNFIDSDFACVNESLAAHYGIAGVVGPQFRRVPLDPSHHRGGVLTQASVLTGNSDGVDGHPIKRGMWLLRNLLDETPPPPPPNVPELNRKDPKVKDLTIIQALAAHRNSPSCAGCHRKIDPWGVAFEEYDAVGNWQRDGPGAELRKQRTKQPIESLAELPRGATVDGMKGLRAELLRSRADDFRRALLRKVMAYALGRSLTLDDIEAADALVPALRERGDRMGGLVELVVSSDPFQSK